MDSPHVGIRLKEQCKIQNLVEIQNASVLYSIAMAWQHEFIHLPRQNEQQKNASLLTGNKTTDA